MKIETKITLNNMQKNIKRTLFTTISIILCTVIIFITMLLISSIRNGFDKIVNKYSKDYHFVIRELDSDSFNKIKDKGYIEKIYVQENDDKPLIEIESKNNFLNIENNINIYIKYKDVKKVCEYSNDIIKTLKLGESATDKCQFNQKLLTMQGVIDIQIMGKSNVVEYRARLNYLYIVDIIVIVTLLAFSILFIIVLYNAFLITINERKREYAILNSIGGTEGQILKMILLEGIIMGTIAMIVGGLISIVSANIILKLLNNIVVSTGYNFKIIFDTKYIISAICIIILNIFISAIIPSVKASTTSIIEGIRNNKQIKCRRNTILEKILPVEGKLAMKNVRRNKNTYRVIISLLVVCMTSYIAVSTYINYEKKTSELVVEYDVDAILSYDPKLNIDYEAILNKYEENYNDKIEYFKSDIMGVFALVEQEENIINHNNIVTKYKDNKMSLQMEIVGLNDKIYNNYISKLNANYGDFIVYNNITKFRPGEENYIYTFNPVFKNGEDLTLSVIAINYNDNMPKYEVIDNKSLSGNFILTDELIEGYKEIKTDLMYGYPAVFVNMDVYNNIRRKFNDYKNDENEIIKNEKRLLQKKWNFDESEKIKIKCNDIIKFSNYIEDIKIKSNIEMYSEYYGIENIEKIIYVKIIDVILKVVIILIIIIGIVSTSNIINASLIEREEDFNILYRLGATKRNINRTLVYEWGYMYIKATIISIILSIPILYAIIKHIENIIIFNELLIPFGSICTFFIIILLIYLFIVLDSTRMIKEE